MLPAGHSRSAAGCEATGRTGRIVGAIDPHTDSRGRTTLGLPMRRHMQHGVGGDRAGPILGPPCGDNRQKHLGGRGPPGCSGERDRWLPLGGDDLNKHTRVYQDRVVSVRTSSVYASHSEHIQIYADHTCRSHRSIQPKINDATIDTTSHATTKRSPSPELPVSDSTSLSSSAPS